jgi:tripartite-type tricarboxylate transporter receptor subunit TctC
MNRSHFLKTLIAGAALAASGLASAQAWPGKPVRFVLGAPAGTAPDTAARILGERLGALWGQPVVIENKPGVGGTLAMELVKGSPADGHTLMFAHAGAVLVTPKFLKAAKYDPVAEFTAIGYVADSPMIIVAGNNVKDKTLADLLKTAQAEPGKLALGSTEQSTLPYLVGHSISQATGAKFLHVPFNQPGQAAQALANGGVQYSIDGIAPLMPLVKGGRISAVASTADRVLPGLEGIPLVKDTLPGFVAIGWFALLGPKGLPADVVTKINKDMNAVLANDEVVKKLRDVSLFPNPRSAPETLEFMKVEIDKWAAVIKKAGIEPL